MEKRGLDFNDVRYNFYYEPGFSSNVSGCSYTAKLKGNAAFSPEVKKGYKSFIIFGKDPRAELPVAMNFTIWAHEFGHNMFDKAFARRDPKAYTSKVESSRAEYYLSGMNEGVADYFASFVTKSNLKNFKMSLSTPMDNRSLPVSFTSSKLNIFSSYYRWGSVLASSLYELGEKYGHERISLQLYRSLENIRKDWEEYPMIFNFHFLIKRMLEQAEQNNLTIEYGKVFLNGLMTKKTKRRLFPI